MTPRSMPGCRARCAPRPRRARGAQGLAATAMGQVLRGGLLSGRDGGSADAAAARDGVLRGLLACLPAQTTRVPSPLRANPAVPRPAGTGPGWRWGFNDWARDGPPRAPARRGGGAAAAGGVFAALERYRDTLEADLHSALLHAFFGPK
jgi:hypothetical protein